MNQSTQAKKPMKSVAEHIRHLYQRLSELEARLERVESRPDGFQEPGDPARSGTPPIDAEILEQVVELEHRLKQLEHENRTLSDLCNQLQEQNAAISNLYVAKHRLHASLDAAEVMRIVKEIMVELIGAKEFGIYLLDPRQKLLRRIAVGGGKKHPETVALGEGHIGEGASTGKPFYFAGATRAPEIPLAVVPLRSESDTIGVIAIWELLPHKGDFTPVDHQLLDSVAEHAPAALKSAHLHQKSRSQSR